MLKIRTSVRESFTRISMKLYQKRTIPLAPIGMISRCLVAVLLRSACTDKKVNEVRPRCSMPANSESDGGCGSERVVLELIRSLVCRIAESQSDRRGCCIWNRPTRRRCTRNRFEELGVASGGPINGQRGEMAHAIRFSGVLPVDTHIHRLAQRGELISEERGRDRTWI